MGVELLAVLEVQLTGYAEPKVLVFVNEDEGPDKHDLRAVLDGYLTYSDGKAAALPPAVETRFREDRDKIDLYVWIDSREGEGARFSMLYARTKVGGALVQKLSEAEHAVALIRCLEPASC